MMMMATNMDKGQKGGPFVSSSSSVCAVVQQKLQ